MGSTRLVTYVVEIEASGPNGKQYYTPSEWRTRSRYPGIPGHGRPNAKNLKAYCDGFVASCKPGNPNAHLGEVTLHFAQIRDERTGDVIAEYKPA